MKLRKKIFNLLEPSIHKHDPNHFFDLFITALIILNVIAIIFASDQSIYYKYSFLFDKFEVFSVLIFSIEYLLRLWTCVELQSYQKPIIGRIKFIFSPMAIIDFLAILPFYLPLVGVDLRFLRILRVFRIFRMLKLARYSKAFRMIKSVLKKKKEELLVALSLVIIILIIISTLMFYAERDAQPNAFGSIPKALWWGVATLTTVGYGDIYPITPYGKILGGLVSLLGIGLIALPSGILASGYTEQLQKEKAEKN